MTGFDRIAVMVARIGGVLLIVGSLIGAVSGIGFAGPAAPDGVRPDDRLLIGAFGILLGAGAGAVAVSAPPVLGSRLTRAGLGMASVGLLSLGIGRLVVVIPPGSNDMASLPFLILVLGGGLVAVAGWLVCGVSLLRAPGWSRLVALVLLAGGLGLLAPPIGPALLAVGFAGVGLLALGVARAR